MSWGVLGYPGVSWGNKSDPPMPYVCNGGGGGGGLTMFLV